MGIKIRRQSKVPHALRIIFCLFHRPEHELGDNHLLRLSFRFLQHLLQSLWIGFVFIGVLVAWLPLPFTLALLFWHFWFMAPRISILLSMRGQSKEVMIKLNPQDVSYYVQ